MKQYLGIIVSKQHDALRLDAFLKKSLPPLDRIAFLRMLKDKEIRVEKLTKGNGANMQAGTYSLDKIDLHTVKNTLLDTLDDPTASNFWYASSSQDNRKRSELPKIDIGAKLSAGDVVFLPKWVTKLVVESSSDASSNTTLLNATSTSTSTQTIQIQDNLSDIISPKPVKTESLRFQDEDAMIPSERTNSRKKKNLTEEDREELLSIGYGSAMISQHAHDGPDSLSGVSRMSLSEAQDLQKRFFEWVLYQDDYVMVINKPYNMAVHQGTKVSRDGHLDKYLDAVDIVNISYRKELASQGSDTFSNLLQEIGSSRSSGNGDNTVVLKNKDKTNHINSKRNINHPLVKCLERPRLVHRLDKECSGLLIIAKTRLAAKCLGAQFAGLSLETTALASADDDEISSLFSGSNIISSQAHPVDLNSQPTQFDAITSLALEQMKIPHNAFNDPKKTTAILNTIPKHVRQAFKIAKTYWAVTVPFNFSHVSEITKHTAALYGLPGFELVQRNAGETITERQKHASGTKAQFNGIRTKMVQEKSKMTRKQSSLNHLNNIISGKVQEFSTVVTSIISIMTKQWKSLSLLDTSTIPSTAGHIDLPIDYSLFDEPISKSKKKQSKTQIPQVLQKDKLLSAHSMFVEMKRLANRCSVVAMQPLTGRKHQLRIHCADPRGLDAPIVGDLKYSSKNHVITSDFYHQIKKHVENVLKVPSIHADDKVEQVINSLHLHCRAMTFQHPAFSRELAHLVSDEEKNDIIKNVENFKKVMDGENRRSNMTLYTTVHNSTMQNKKSSGKDRDKGTENTSKIQKNEHQTSQWSGLLTVVAPVPEHMKITMEAFGASYDARADISLEFPNLQH